MDDFLKKFFPNVYRRKQEHLHETDYCKYDDQILTLFTSSLYFAGLVSTFGASYVTRKYGRRISIMGGAVSFFLGGAINAGAINIFMLIVGRILLGVGIGFGNQVRADVIPFSLGIQSSKCARNALKLQDLSVLISQNNYQKILECLSETYVNACIL